MTDLLKPINDIFYKLSEEILIHSRNSSNFLKGEIDKATTSIKGEILIHSRNSSNFLKGEMDKTTGSIKGEMNKVSGSIRNETALIATEIKKISPDFDSHLHGLIKREQLPELITDISKSFNINQFFQLLENFREELFDAYILKRDLISITNEFEEILQALSKLASNTTNNELKVILESISLLFNQLEIFIGAYKQQLERIDDTIFNELKIPDPIDLGKVSKLLKDVRVRLDTISNSDPSSPDPEITRKVKVTLNRTILIFSPLAEALAEILEYVGEAYPLEISVGLAAGVSVGVEGSGSAESTVAKVNFSIMGGLALLLKSTSRVLQTYLNILEEWDKNYS